MKNEITWKHGMFVLVIIFLLRLPAFWTPILDIDESQFAGFADTLLYGGTPYISSLDTKPLGIYYFFAAIFWIFGKNDMIAVHLATALWVGLTALFCYRIATKIYSQRAGLMAALFYAIFTTTYIPKFISTSIVLLMMLPLTMSIDAFLEWEQHGKRRYLWISGILWGLACLFKYQAGINLIVMAAYLLLFRPLYLERSLSKMKIRAFLMFGAGGAIVCALFALHLMVIGAWDAFVFWSLKGSMAYIEAATSVTVFWKNLALRGGAIVASSLLVWLFAIRRSGHLMQNLFRSSRHRIHKCEEYLILLWLGLSFIPVCMGGKFYGHYFHQLLPALCILAAGSTMRFFAWLKEDAVTPMKQWLYGLFVVGMLVPMIGFFGARLMADRIYSAIGEENPKDYLPIAEYVKKRSQDGDRIFVWGFATPIYYFSDRIPASRFLWCDWMTGRISGTRSARDAFFDTTPFITKGSWEMFFEDMRINTPIYFVDTSPGNYHDYGKYPISRYPQLMNWLNERYTFEAHVKGADIYRRIDQQPQP